MTDLVNLRKIAESATFADQEDMTAGFDDFGGFAVGAGAVLALIDRVETLHTRNLALQMQADTAEHDRQLAWRDMDRSRTEKAEAVKKAERELEKRTKRLEHFEHEYNLLETVVENMDRALQRVRELHQKYYTAIGIPICNACGTPYPCPTIKALEGDDGSI